MITIRRLTCLPFWVGITLTAMTAFPVAAEPLSETLQYQRLLAKQVRTVSQAVLPSVVTIETIGVLQSDGEVRQDAPTSGVVLDQDGHILTSSWVARSDAASIIVTVEGKNRFPASIVARDEHRELVLLKIDPQETKLIPIELPEVPESPADSEKEPPAIGSTMIALARYGEQQTPMVSTGVLSAVDRLGGTAIQTDARVSPVFYGGPLLDLRGRVRGILIPAVGEFGSDDPTAWYDSGIAFAVPTDVVLGKLSRLIAGESIRRGVLGFVIEGGDPYAPGTTIATVRPRSPVQRAGLQAGDRLLKVGGRDVRRLQEIKLALGRFDAGEEVEIEFERGGKTQKIRPELSETIPPLVPQGLGLIAKQVNGDGLEISRVHPAWPAAQVLKAGDRITRLDNRPIKDLDVFRQQIWTHEPDESIAIEVVRSNPEQAAQSDSAQETSPLDLTLETRSWAGSIELLQLAQPETIDAPGDWQLEPIQLPDVANQAWLWHPKQAEAETAAEKREDENSEVEDQAEPPPLGLLVQLLAPTERDADSMDAWKEVAQQYQVAICLIASEQEEKWSLPEIDAISKITAAALKQSGADPQAVAIGGRGMVRVNDESSPSDSMALATALSNETSYHGILIASNTKPPAVRLRGDGPLRLLRVLMFGQAIDQELPTWTTGLERLGLPVQTATELQREQVLAWVRSLLML